MWAWTYAPPLKTFISGNSLNGKRLAFMVTSGAEMKKCFDKLHKALGVSDMLCLSLVEPLKNKKADDIAEVKAFTEKIRGI